MLFHLTMTHTTEDCPGYNQERMHEIMAAYDKIDEAAKQFNVKVHFIVGGLPEHVDYALLEADSCSDLALFVTQIPFRLHFKVTPVEHWHDTVAKMKAMMKEK